MKTERFGFDATAAQASVTELQRKFQTLPPAVLVALMVKTLLERNVTPQRLCACGCGEFVTGKAHCASPACRKRLERQRSAARPPGAQQFNFPLQSEIPVPIPHVPAHRPAPAVQGSEISAPARNDLEKEWDEFWGEGSTKRTKEAIARRSPMLFEKFRFNEVGMMVPRESFKSDCRHEYGFISLAGDCSEYFCSDCEQTVTSYIPCPPERLGYTSAIWNDWERKFPRRYPNQVRKEFSALPLDDEEKEFIGLTDNAEK